MYRRAFVFAALAASLAPGAGWATSGLQVIYVGGLDCPPCQRWRSAHEDAWFASREYRKVKWVEIESPRLREAYQERYWPAELRPVLAQLPRRRGTPRFLIVQDGKVVSNEFGVSKWASTLADLRKLLEE